MGDDQAVGHKHDFKFTVNVEASFMGFYHTRLGLIVCY